MRKQLIDRMVALYGEENPIVVQFRWYAENLPISEWNDTTLRVLVEAHEADPIVWNED